MTKRALIVGFVLLPLLIGAFTRIAEEDLRAGDNPWWLVFLLARYVLMGSVLTWGALRLIRMDRRITELQTKVESADARLGAIADHIATEQLLVEIERQAMAQTIADREAGIYDLQQ